MSLAKQWWPVGAYLIVATGGMALIALLPQAWQLGVGFGFGGWCGLMANDIADRGLRQKTAKRKVR